MAKYKLLNEGVFDKEENRWFSAAHNRYWTEYEKWLSKGNIPDPEHDEQELLFMAKNNKLKEIKHSAKQQHAEAVTFKGAKFSASQEMIDEMLQSKSLAEIEGLTEVEVLDLDGIERVLPVADLSQLLMIISKKFRPIRSKQRKLVMEVNNAANVAAVENIKWTA